MQGKDLHPYNEVIVSNANPIVLRTRSTAHSFAPLRTLLTIQSFPFVPAKIHIYYIIQPKYAYRNWDHGPTHLPWSGSLHIHSSVQSAWTVTRYTRLRTNNPRTIRLAPRHVTNPSPFRLLSAPSGSDSSCRPKFSHLAIPTHDLWVWSRGETRPTECGGLCEAGPLRLYPTDVELQMVLSIDELLLLVHKFTFFLFTFAELEVGSDRTDWRWLD